MRASRLLQKRPNAMDIGKVGDGKGGKEAKPTKVKERGDRDHEGGKGDHKEKKGCKKERPAKHQKRCQDGVAQVADDMATTLSTASLATAGPSASQVAAKARCVRCVTTAC